MTGSKSDLMLAHNRSRSKTPVAEEILSIMENAVYDAILPIDYPCRGGGGSTNYAKNAPQT